MKDYNSIKGGTVILAEHSADAYFKELAEGLKNLLKKGYTGVYLNSQRPFNNLSMMLKKYDVDAKNIIFVNFTKFVEESKYSKEPRCIFINPSISFEQLAVAVRKSISSLKAKKKFIFIDSITTLALYENMPEKMLFHFYGFLIDTARKGQDILILNVSTGMAQKPIIKDLVFFVDINIT